MKQKLTFTDGLNFGCGFWVAGFMFFTVALPLGVFVVMLFLAVFGALFAGLAGSN